MLMHAKSFDGGRKFCGFWRYQIMIVLAVIDRAIRRISCNDEDECPNQDSRGYDLKGYVRAPSSLPTSFNITSFTHWIARLPACCPWCNQDGTEGES